MRFDGTSVLDEGRGVFDFLKIAKGSLIAVGFSLMTLLIFTAIFLWTNLDMGLAPILIGAISYVCSFLAGYVTGCGFKRAGWLYGGGAGLLYAILIDACSLLFFETSPEIFGFFGSVVRGLILGALGGIIAVNLHSGSRRR